MGGGGGGGGVGGEKGGKEVMEEWGIKRKDDIMT